MLTVCKQSIFILTMKSTLLSQDLIVPNVGNVIIKSTKVTEKYILECAVHKMSLCM